LKRAVIDIGSNSVLLLIAEVEDGKITKELCDKSHITSLGRDLDKTLHFHQDSMRDTILAFEDYAKEVDFFKIPRSEVKLFATEASRVAKNAEEFFKKAYSTFGFKVKIIDGNEEARLTTNGVLSDFQSNVDTCVVMDMGGASTEFITVNVKKQKIINSKSLPFGSVRTFNWIQAGEFEEKMKHVLEEKLDDYSADEIVCVAGGMTSIASMFYGHKVFSANEIDGRKIKVSDLKVFFESIKSKSPEELLSDFSFLGKRAIVINAALEAALLVFNKLGVKRICISTKGLRHGALLEEK